MDEVDSPMIRPRNPRSSTTSFQSELSSKLADRRKKNLTTDITSDESDSEDDFVGELGFNSRSRNRPNSAKRRQESPDLGATLRFQDRDSLFGSLDNKSAGRSKFLKKQTTIDKSPESHKSGLTAEDILYGKPSPRSEDKKSPFLSRKSPLLDDITNKRGTEWQPPSYQMKAPSPDFLQREPSDLSRSRLSRDSSNERDDSRGRSQFDKSPRLEPLDSPTGKPSPRPRHRDSSSEEVKKKRSTPTMDLFGTKRITLDDDEEEEVKFPSPKPKRRQSKDLDRQKSFEGKRSGAQTPVDGRKTPVDGRKTPVDGRKTPVDGRKTPIDGRKTPTGRKMSVEGRKTPTDKRRMTADERKSYAGRKTPTEEGRTRTEGRKSPTDERGARRTPSLMELMAGDGDTSVDDKKYRSSYKKEKSNDSFSEEMEGYLPRNDDRRLNRSASLKRNQRKDADTSSVCEEYEVDPNPPSEKLHTDPVAKSRKSSKNQTSEHKECDEIIDNIADAQNTMQYINPDKANKTTDKKNKTDQHKPKARYSTPTSPIVYDINDTKSMREAVFNQWKLERTKQMQQDLKEKKKKEKEKQEKEEQEKKEKKLEAMSSFNAWNEKKKEELKKQLRNKHKEEKKIAEKEHEKEEKKIDAIKSFEAWKETKDHIIKKTLTKKQREELKKKQQEEEDKRNREKSASSAFRSWKDKKEVVIKKKIKEEKRNQPDLYEEEKMKARKEEAAREQYEIWLEEKEKRERKEKEKKRHHYSSDEMETRPAWSPANKTIPFGR